MTLTDLRDADSDRLDGEVAKAASPSVDPPSARHLRTAQMLRSHRAVLLLALFIGAFSVRLFAIKSSYNLFIDEITYTEISNNLAGGHGLNLYGEPFNLHPPAMFAWLAAVIKVFGLSSNSVDQLVLALRPTVALFGAGTVVICVHIARRCGARPVAVAFIAVVLALDPFVISFDSRVMLEAIAQFFVAATVLAVVTLAAIPSDGWRRRGVVAVGGLAAGAAFCTKETFGLVLAAFLVLAVLLPRLAPRRAVLGVLGGGAGIYAAVTVAIWTTSGFEPWWRSHASGLSRLLGTEQDTGFNAATTKVSLASRVAANLGQFGATYLLLGLGGLTVLVHLLRLRPWRTPPSVHDRPFGQPRTLIAVWGFAACSYLVYATAFGSIEEQMYYIPFAPVVIVLATLGSEAGRARAVRTLRRRALPLLLATLAALTITMQAVVWVQVHTHDDNTYEQFLTWERVNVTAGSRVAVSEDIAQFALSDVVVGKWTTLASIRDNKADYVLVESTLVEQGYSALSVPTLDYLQHKAPIAFSATSRTDGTLYLFDVRRLPSQGGP